MTGARDKKTVMVFRIIGDCGTKGGRDKVGFYLVPAIITNQGEEFEELTQEENSLDFRDRPCRPEGKKCFALVTLSLAGQRQTGTGLMLTGF